MRKCATSRCRETDKRTMPVDTVFSRIDSSQQYIQYVNVFQCIIAPNEEALYRLFFLEL